MAKIVIATPILFDKGSPFNHLFYDIIGGFLDAGNHVVHLVACSDENESDFMYGYNNKKIEYRRYIRKKAARSNIIMRYLKDSLTNVRMARGIKKIKDADVLFEDVSYSSYPAVRAAKKKGMRVVAMLQDVWPDNAVRSGLIKEGSLLYRYFEMRQRFVYRKSDKIICISDDMKAFIIGKGISANKIDVIYNWGYSDDTVDIPWSENQFVRKYNLDADKFYAVYAGNIGRMQNVELIVDAAKELQNRTDIHFLIVGDGVQCEAIRQKIAAYRLKNVTMLPMQPSELAVHIYSAAGVNIIPLVPGGIKTALPSKTGVVLSCGQPVVFCYGSNTLFSKTAAEYQAGFCLDSDDLKGLVKSIAACRENPPERSKVHKMYVSVFSKSLNVKKYVEAVNEFGQDVE